MARKQPLYPHVPKTSSPRAPSPGPMEYDVRRLGIEDLLNIVADRFAAAISQETLEEGKDWAQADKCIGELKRMAEKYRIDERRIR